MLKKNHKSTMTERPTRISIETKKINTLFEESDNYVKINEELENDVHDLTKEQEKVTGATEKLRELGTLKGKISNKVTTITREHKFFTDNVTCPTCTQVIDKVFKDKKKYDRKKSKLKLKQDLEQK